MQAQFPWEGQLYERVIEIFRSGERSLLFKALKCVGQNFFTILRRV
jgi:hypothetical protein